MIVASLLLIVVAVVLLVLGLSGGSSALLISSIAASLLAAVALVVGARQSAAARRGPDSRDAQRSDAAGVDARRWDAAGVGPTSPGAGTAAPAASGRSAPPGDVGGAGVQSAVVVDEPLTDTGESDVGGTGRNQASAVQGTDGQAAAAFPETDPAALGRAAGRRDAGDWFESAVHDGQSAASSTDGAAVAGSATPAGAGELRRDPAEGAAPDEDDPADEPAVQRVSAADAAQVARLHTEVLVVDGRPRYHLAGCPHVGGRSAEALPAAEAVELGFSPCALCRPVDRLLLTIRRG